MFCTSTVAGADIIGIISVCLSVFFVFFMFAVLETNKRTYMYIHKLDCDFVQFVLFREICSRVN